MVFQRPSIHQVLSNSFGILIALGLLSGCAVPYSTSTGTSSSTGISVATAAQTSTGMYLSYGASSVSTGGTDQFTATGGTAPYTYTVSPSSAGAISSSGLFTASTTAESVEITATDSNGNVAYATIVIGSSSATLAMNTTAVSVPANGTYTFSATGGTAPYTFFVASPTAPDGGTINSSSGAYTAPSYVGQSIVIAVEDSAGNWAYSTVTTTTPNYVNLCTTNTGCEQAMGFSYEIDGGMISSAALNAKEACLSKGYTGVYDYNVEQHSIGCGGNYGLMYWTGSAFVHEEAPICGYNYVMVISEIDCTTQ